jgi:hypothetical protein
MKIARILSIDGGGIRGLIPASLLSNFEKSLGMSISKCFHMVAGTSTGGIIACGLTQPKNSLSAAKVVDFYKTHGQSIFESKYGIAAGAVGSIYEAAPLEKAISEVLNGTISEVVANDLLVTAYDIETRAPHIFKSWKGQESKADNYKIKDVARATSAAPTYFPPARIFNQSNKAFSLVDGGVYANNPAMCAYVAARRLYPTADQYLIVSIGTGKLRNPFPYDDAKDWGFVGWAQPLLSMMFDGVSDTIDYELSQLGPEVASFRFQADLARIKASEAMDNVTDENLAALISAGDDIWKTDSDKINAVISILRQPLIDRAALGYSVKKEAVAPKVFTKPKLTATKTLTKALNSDTIEGKVSLLGAATGAVLGGLAAGPIGMIAGATAGYYGGKEFAEPEKKT